MERLNETNYRARAGIAPDGVAHILMEPRVSGDPRLPTIALRLAPSVTRIWAESMAESFNEGQLTAFRYSPEQRLYGDDIPELTFG